MHPDNGTLTPLPVGPNDRIIFRDYAGQEIEVGGEVVGDEHWRRAGRLEVARPCYHWAGWHDDFVHFGPARSGYPDAAQPYIRQLHDRGTDASRRGDFLGVVAAECPYGRRGARHVQGAGAGGQWFSEAGTGDTAIPDAFGPAYKAEMVARLARCVRPAEFGALVGARGRLQMAIDHYTPEDWSDSSQMFGLTINPQRIRLHVLRAAYAAGRAC